LISLYLFIQNKNVKIKLAKNILESEFTFLDNKLFFDDLRINDKTLFFYGVKILDLRGNELLYISNLNIKLKSFTQLSSKTVTIKSIELVDPKLYLEKYFDNNSTNLELFLKSIETRGILEKLKIQNLIVSNSSIDYRQNNNQQNSIVKDLNFVFDEIAINSDSLNISLKSSSFESNEFGNLENASLKLNKVYDNIYVDQLDLIYNNYLINGNGDLSYCSDNTYNTFENFFFNDFSIKTTIPKKSLTDYEFYQDVKIRNRFSGSIKNLFSKFKINVSDKSFSEGYFTMKFNSADDLKIEGEKIYTILQKDDVKKFVKMNSPNLLSGEFEPLNNIEITTDFKSRLNSFFIIESKLNINNGFIQLNIDLEKKENKWKISNLTTFNDFPFYSIYQKLGKIKFNGFSRLNTLVDDSKIIESLDLKVSLDSFEFNNRIFNDINISLDKDLNETYSLNTNINDEKLKIHLSSSISNQFDKILNLKSSLFASNFSYSLSPMDKKEKNIFFDLDYNFSKSPNSIFVKNISFNETLFRPFALNFKTPLNKDGQIFSKNEAFNFSLSSNLKFSKLSSFLRQNFDHFFNQNKSNLSNSYLNFSVFLKEKFIKALYPELNNPSPIKFEIGLEDKNNNSYVELDIPFLSTSGYNIESLSLKLDRKKEFFKFDIGTFKNNNFLFKKLKLTTNTDKKNRALLTGLYGEDEERFEIFFEKKFLNKKITLELNDISFYLDREHWKLKDSTSSITYNQNTKEFNLKNFLLETKSQAISTNIRYKSTDDFDFKLITKDLKINQFLPQNEKIDLSGFLSSEIIINQNKELQSATASLNIKNLDLNKNIIGDLDFTLNGSPIYKTFKISASVANNYKKNIFGIGNVYILDKDINLDIDFNLDDFDLSFLSSFGKSKVNKIHGIMSGKLNLWGSLSDIKLKGQTLINKGNLYLPITNTEYKIKDRTPIYFQDQSIKFVNTELIDSYENTIATANGNLYHKNFKDWGINLDISSQRLLVFNKTENIESRFYGKGFLDGKASFKGPFKSLNLSVSGVTANGTNIVIPWQENKGLSDTSFIDFVSKSQNKTKESTNAVLSFDEQFRGFEMIFDLDITRDAELEIVVDQKSGSTLSGIGNGKILIETNTDGKFNIFGDYVTYDGIYNFKNLGLIDKKFTVKPGGTIVWNGDPTDAQLNILATYEVPGGANPALLVDNPNFNRKIPTDVSIQLIGNLLKPNDPIFDITFPNTTGVISSEINYRLSDQEIRQTQALSLLSQGIFISQVSVSFQGITNNLYEKASDVLSTLIGGSGESKLNVGLNYLQGENNALYDLQTEDRIGLSLSTQLSDKILINGKIGVPIDGMQQTVIVGDVQIDFILNEKGNLRAKIFNRENDFRYLGDEFGYTQGMGLSYQVDFNTFKNLINKIKSESLKTK
jgi:hypothetical protein